MSSPVTDDALLNGRVRLRQPQTGFRASADAVLLAAACAPPEGARVLDAGCGAGAVMLCLAWRRADLDITGLEIDAELAALCAHNIDANGFSARARCVTGDISAPRAAADEPADEPADELAGELFDAVISNPPFHKHGAARPPADAARALALHENPAFDLTAWTAACLGRLRPGGALTMIVSAARESEVTAALKGRAGGRVVTPLCPHAGAAAKRVIISARMGADADGTDAPPVTRPALILHGADGADTPAARAILRDGEALG